MYSVAWETLAAAVATTITVILIAIFFSGCLVCIINALTYYNMLQASDAFLRAQSYWPSRGSPD